MARKRKSREAAAAALAAAGVVVVGGKLVHDRLTGDDDEPSREYRLDGEEFVPDGIRRIARGQLDCARDDLDGTPKRRLGEGVHEARKRLKRLRAVLRLTRGGLPAEVYASENDAFRDAARELAAARDAKVLLETLDAVHERFADELPAGATGGLRDHLEADHERATAELRSSDGPVHAVLAGLEQARERTATWTFEREDFDALRPGLRRIYRRGRRDLRAAEADPSTENLHEWRKRVKDLWHAAQILRPAAPKRMKKLAKEAHALADLLGHDHDLAVLRAHVDAHPEQFDDEDTRRALTALIDRRRRALQRRALKRGRRIYDRSPKRFVRRVEKGWDKRTSRAPQPVAG
jgi:CHAD domain-containing protein